MDRRGFTLIELLISITILAFMAAFLANSVKSATQQKNKVTNQIGRSSALRSALSIISRDISLAFNYRDVNVELYNEAQKEREKRKVKKPPVKPPAGGTPPPAATPFVPKEEVILTHFQGDSSELHFTTRSFVRTQQDQQVSDLAEVGYYLKDCKNRIDKSKRSQCLWRRISPLLDDKVEEGGSSTVLLENVSSFKLRYMGPDPGAEELSWDDKWKSGEGSDAITKNHFPYAVEATIEILDKNKERDKPLAMTQVTAIRFSNNPIAKAPTEPEPEGEPVK